MTHYEILGIRKTASTDEIKNAYKKLVKKYHPDVYAGDKTFAEKKIKEINEAYDVLSNPDQKREYDELINPQTTTSYRPQDYSSHTYKTPNYDYSASSHSYKTTTSKRNAQARDSKYSYENYRKTYNSTNYGGYDYQKRYTDYHRSKTPNSNYSGSNPEQTTITKESVTKISAASKIFIVAIILIFYIIFLISNLIEVSKFWGSNSDEEQQEEYIPSSQTDIYKDFDTTPKQSYEEYYNDKYNTNETTEEPTEDEFDINTVYSDAELLEVYNDYFRAIYPTFEEFKQAMEDYYYQTYYQDYF